MDGAEIDLADSWAGLGSFFTTFLHSLSVASKNTASRVFITVLTTVVAMPNTSIPPPPSRRVTVSLVVETISPVSTLTNLIRSPTLIWEYNTAKRRP